MKRDIKWKIKSVQIEDLLDSWSGRVIKSSGGNLPNVFLVLNLGSNLDRIQKPQGKLKIKFQYISNTKRKLLDFVSYGSWITLYSATNPSRVPLTFVQPNISLAFLVIWYSSQSDFSFVVQKHFVIANPFLPN